PAGIGDAEGARAAILHRPMATQPEDLRLYSRVGVSGRRDLALGPGPRQGFEMLLLRMLAFRPAPAAPVELDLQTALQKKKPLRQAAPPDAAAAPVPAPAPIPAPAQPGDPPRGAARPGPPARPAAPAATPA